MPTKKQLDLYMDVDVLTAGTTSKIVNAILETLLFQRNQIPFVYKTYRYYVNKWQEKDESNIENSLPSFQAQRKKQQATTTKERISSMRQVIKAVFERKPIKCLRFLFGSTIFTAKEAYTIHIPTENISANHFYERHGLSTHKLNQTLLSLVTSEDLYTIFSQHLNPTNIYLELEIMEIENAEHNKNSMQYTDIFLKDFSPLPASCKDIHIHLRHEHSPTVNLNHLMCCKELKVFDDLLNLNLDCKKEKDNPKEVRSDKTFTNATSAWWEADIVVRGFKDHPIKGFNIWN